MNAMMRKLMQALMNDPKSIPVPGMTNPPTSAFPPVTKLMSGLDDVRGERRDDCRHAPPMMMPTAMSITSPWLMNSLNSLKKLMVGSSLGSSDLPVHSSCSRIICKEEENDA